MVVFSEEKKQQFDKLYKYYMDANMAFERNDYNTLLAKSRRIVESMCRYYYSKVGLEKEDLRTMIDTLYRNEIITSISKNNYHQIRMKGNEAVHDDLDDEHTARSIWTLVDLEINEFLTRQDKEFAVKIDQSAPKPMAVGVKVLIALLCAVCACFMIHQFNPKDKSNGTKESISSQIESSLPIEQTEQSVEEEPTTEPIKSSDTKKNTLKTTCMDGMVKVSLLSVEEEYFEIKIENNAEQEIRMATLPAIISKSGEATNLSFQYSDNKQYNMDHIIVPNSFKTFKLKFSGMNGNDIARITGELFIQNPKVTDRSYILDIE